MEQSHIQGIVVKNKKDLDDVSCSKEESMRKEKVYNLQKKGLLMSIFVWYLIERNFELLLLISWEFIFKRFYWKQPSWTRFTCTKITKFTTSRYVRRTTRGQNCVMYCHYLPIMFFKIGVSKFRPKTLSGNVQPLRRTKTKELRNSMLLLLFVLFHYVLWNMLINSSCSSSASNIHKVFKKCTSSTEQQKETK